MLWQTEHIYLHTHFSLTYKYIKVERLNLKWKLRKSVLVSARLWLQTLLEGFWRNKNDSDIPCFQESATSLKSMWKQVQTSTWLLQNPCKEKQHLQRLRNTSLEGHIISPVPRLIPHIHLSRQRFSGPTWATKYKSVDARVLAELEGQAILFGLWLFGKSPCQVWGQRRGPGSVSPEHQEPPGLLALFLPLHGRQGSRRGKFALLKHVASSSLCALRTRRRDLLWWTFSTLTAYLWVTRFPYETPIQVGEGRPPMARI